MAEQTNSQQITAVPAAGPAGLSPAEKRALLAKLLLPGEATLCEGCLSLPGVEVNAARPDSIDHDLPLSHTN